MKTSKATKKDFIPIFLFIFTLVLQFLVTFIDSRQSLQAQYLIDLGFIKLPIIFYGFGFFYEVYLTYKRMSWASFSGAILNGLLFVLLLLFLMALGGSTDLFWDFHAPELYL